MYIYLKGHYIVDIADYGIAGKPIGGDGQCNFLFKSDFHKSGFFNSPRHPDMYPPNLKCDYIFQPTINEQLLITFDMFSLDSTPNQLIGTDRKPKYV